MSKRTRLRDQCLKRFSPRHRHRVDNGTPLLRRHSTPISREPHACLFDCLPSCLSVCSPTDEHLATVSLGGASATQPGRGTATLLGGCQIRVITPCVTADSAAPHLGFYPLPTYSVLAAADAALPSRCFRPSRSAPPSYVCCQSYYACPEVSNSPPSSAALVCVLDHGYP